MMVGILFVSRKVFLLSMNGFVFLGRGLFVMFLCVVWKVCIRGVFGLSEKVFLMYLILFLILIFGF